MANLERRRAVDSPGEDEDHEEQQEREGVEAQLDDGDLPALQHRHELRQPMFSPTFI